jgi:hypothetical protein
MYYTLIIIHRIAHTYGYVLDISLIIAASKWPQPHLNEFTHESSEWSVPKRKKKKAMNGVRLLTY